MYYCDVEIMTVGTTMRLKLTAIILLFFVLGIALGGYLFSQSLRRQLLEFKSCKGNCYKPAEVAGLITSATLLRTPIVIPGTVLESDSCLAIRNPRSEQFTHYVLFPKHDIKNITSLSTEDTPYVLGCFALARELVVKDHLHNYRLYTNGPGLQEIAYLHFHLTAGVPN